MKASLKGILMSDKTKQFIIILYSVLFAACIAFVVFRIGMGWIAIGDDLTKGLTGFILSLLTPLGVFLAAWLLNHQAAKRSVVTQAKIERVSAEAKNGNLDAAAAKVVQAIKDDPELTAAAQGSGG